MRYSTIIIIFLIVISIPLLILHNTLKTQNEIINLYKEYNVNISNNESLLRCNNGSYEVLSKNKLFVCGLPNDKYKLKH